MSAVDRLRAAAALLRERVALRVADLILGSQPCVCGVGVGDQVEAWLAARVEPYDWAEDEGSGLR